MKAKLLFLVCLFFVSLFAFIFSTHVFSENIISGLDATSLESVQIVNPGFPPAGQYDSVEAKDAPELIAPIDIAGASSTAHDEATTPSSAEPVIVNEVMPESVAAKPVKPANEAQGESARLLIPSINLDIAIGSVGLTSTGEMDVLNDPGKVSWYNGGVVPGTKGSAVIGAHVFQAFAHLKDVQIGNYIYIEYNGSKSRFVVTEIAAYPYNATEPLPKIFTRMDKARLNLITCDGKVIDHNTTYDHRLVVFTELVI